MRNADEDRSALWQSEGFRRALTDKLKHLARESRWELPHLQRQIAYDRLLERLYITNGGWILKGATALLARGLGVRGTLDIDLYRRVAAATAVACYVAARRSSSATPTGQSSG